MTVALIWFGFFAYIGVGRRWCKRRSKYRSARRCAGARFALRDDTIAGRTQTVGVGIRFEA